MRKIRRSLQLLAILIATSSMSAQADTIGVSLLSKKAVAQSELQWWKGQPGILVGNADAQLLLKYINTDSKWQIGPVQAKSFNYVKDLKSLETMLVQGVGSKAAFALQSSIRLSQNGIAFGDRTMTPYIFACKSSRNPKGYSAVLASGRDLNTGNWWTRAIVLEGENGDKFNFHEYAVRGGKVELLSFKKGETWLRQAMTMAAGYNKAAFENQTLARMQKSSNLYSQTQEFLVNDASNAAVNTTCTITVQLSTSEKEPWWKGILTKALDQLKKLAEKFGQTLLTGLWDWVKSHAGSVLASLGSEIKGILGWLAGLFGWL